MDAHLKLYATQLTQLTQKQTHPLHDLNAYSDLPKNIKATIIHKNEHTNIITPEPDVKPKQSGEKLKHTNIQPHNTSVLEKTTKLLTPQPITFIH